jgi:hypothetical protein
MHAGFWHENMMEISEPGLLSRYNDWLRPGRDQGIGIQVPVGQRIFSSPRRPDRL